MLRLRSILFAVMLLPAVPVRSAPMFDMPPMTSLKHIRDLSVREAEKALPVRVEGQILWKNPFDCSFFLHSDGVGVFVSRPDGAVNPDDLIEGDLVRVEGVTDKGDFSPSLIAASVERIGKAPLPEPREFHSYELFFTQNDCDWVRVMGRIVSMRTNLEIVGRKSIEFQVDFLSLPITVEVPLSDDGEQKLRELMFRRVRFDAVVGTQFNANRQVVGRTFYISSVDEIRVLDQYKPPVGAKERAIHELARFKEDPYAYYSTRGLVTHAEGEHIYLRGDEACLKVMLRENAAVKPGDYVEVSGYTQSGPISPGFLAREIRILEKRPAPKPVEMKLSEELRARWDLSPDSYLNHELIQIDAELVNPVESFGLATGSREQMLLCRQGKYMFTAKLPFSPKEIKALRPGAKIRLTGICNLTRNPSQRWRLYVDWFWIEPRNPGDVKILVPAPWWTPGRLFGLLGIVLGIAGLFLCWIFVLRRTVEKQTGVIAEKIEHESVLNERQRIARELHDNLSQGLVGAGMLLESSCEMQVETTDQFTSELRKIAETEDRPETKRKLLGLLNQFYEQTSQNRAGLDTAYSMLRYCSDESRRSILDLRGGLLERMRLPEAVNEILVPLAAESDAEIEMNVTGTPRRLKQMAERNLLMVVQEAVTNAVRHGRPSKVTVSLNYRETALSLSIEDDGCGCDPEPLAKPGHFGLRGMRERINRLHGQIKFARRKGGGFGVYIELPELIDWENETI